jgi:hypothetical protein
MWRNVLLGVVLAGVLAGCSLGGVSGTGSAQVISPRTVAATLSRIGLSKVNVAGPTTSRPIRSIKLYRGRGVQVSWVIVGGFGSSTPLGGPNSPVGVVQVFGAESAAQAKAYVARKPGRVFRDLNGATLVSSYDNAIVVVGGTPASAARAELRRVVNALAATG